MYGTAQISVGWRLTGSLVHREYLKFEAAFRGYVHGSTILVLVPHAKREGYDGAQRYDSHNSGCVIAIANGSPGSLSPAHYDHIVVTNA